MDELINALQNAQLYPHETHNFNVIETHISWVLLTGQHAYKIKKPVNFGFIDYTSLEKRKYYCELELSLNKKLAPELYEKVLPITGSKNEPVLDGEGPVIEYAIKMHQFEQDRLLSNVQQEEGLSKAITRSIATQIAAFHQKTNVCDEHASYGQLEQIFDPMMDNFEALKSSKVFDEFSQALNTLSIQTKKQFESLKEVLKSRKQNGFIRACHGDLRLSNIVLHRGKPVIFDCIEFNEDFRNIDVISDVAFLAMDLEHKNHKDLAHDFCNHYLECTSDYIGAQLLNFYKTYRAMIWAKISTILLEPLSKDDPQYRQVFNDLERYINLALSYQIEKKPELMVTFGPSGCGKSTYTDKLLIDKKAIRLRSDMIRKHLFNVPLNQKTPTSLLKNLYSEQANKQVYQALYEHASKLLACGYPVIIDATCLKTWQRELFLELSHEHEVPLNILEFHYDLETLKSRLKNRQSDPVSDADLNVLEKQLASIEPLTHLEKTYAKSVE